MEMNNLKNSIFKKITALLLVLLIGLLLPACSSLPDDIRDEDTTAELNVITEEDQTDETSEPEEETNQPQAPPEDKTNKIESSTKAEKTTKAPEAKKTTEASKTEDNKNKVVENGKYDTKDEVALYIHLYGHLPSNFMTKKQAENKGWSGGSLKKIAPGYSIGGDRFGNYEGLLPKAKGRTYTECDIGTTNSNSRGAKRIIFSNDGLIFYTDDHYESFTQLY